MDLEFYKSRLIDSVKDKVTDTKYLRGFIIEPIVELEVHLDYYISCLFFGGILNEKARFFRKYVLQTSFGLASKIELLKDLIKKTKPKNIDKTRKWLENLTKMKVYRDRMAHGSVASYELMKNWSADRIIETFKKDTRNRVELSKQNIDEFIGNYISCLEFYIESKDDIETFFGSLEDNL